MSVAASETMGRLPVSAGAGVLIVNADDWGRNRATTDRILVCVRKRVVSSASGMVFMADSERAAALAREQGVDVGLHLNLTTLFDGSACPAGLREQQSRIIRYLRGHRLAQVLYSPTLAGVFRAVVEAQIAEYGRLYGHAPRRLDGHHHMHLCANLLRDHLLPSGAIVRRSFSFQPGEKSALNRWYRRGIDRRLAQRHHTTDFFFQLAPMAPPARLERVFAVTRGCVLELETHPVNDDEFVFLTSDGVARLEPLRAIASGYALSAGAEEREELS